MTIPRRLYHYTGQEGLVGILQDRSIRATDLRFVNDRTEYQHAIDIATRLLSTNPDPSDELLFEHIRELLRDPTEYMTGNVFIASFSEYGDDLNQWRAYSTDGSGFCLGFDARSLAQSVGNSWQLSQCIYEDSEKDQAVARILANTLAARKQKEWPLDETYVAEKLSDLFVDELATVAPVLKDRAFESEREWRLWSVRGNEQLNWRPGSKAPVPFVEVAIDAGRENPIRSVCVGPTADIWLGSALTACWQAFSATATVSKSRCRRCRTAAEWFADVDCGRHANEALKLTRRFAPRSLTPGR